MAFVNEFVPEEQKSKFDPEIFRQPGPFGGPIPLFRWTVDKGRGVFLICLGGGGREQEIPRTYALSWEGEVVKFDAVQTAEGNRKDGAIVNWEVSNIRIPNQLEAKRELVIQLLREGLDAMGTLTCNRDGVITVNVHFK